MDVTGRVIVHRTNTQHHKRSLSILHDHSIFPAFHYVADRNAESAFSRDVSPLKSPNWFYQWKPGICCGYTPPLSGQDYRGFREKANQQELQTHGVHGVCFDLNWPFFSVCECYTHFILYVDSCASFAHTLPAAYLATRANPEPIMHFNYSYRANGGNR